MQQQWPLQRPVSVKCCTVDACCRAAQDIPLEDELAGQILEVAENMDGFAMVELGILGKADAAVEVEKARSLKLLHLQRFATTRCMHWVNGMGHDHAVRGDEAVGTARIPWF